MGNLLSERAPEVQLFFRLGFCWNTCVIMAEHLRGFWSGLCPVGGSYVGFEHWSERWKRVPLSQTFQTNLGTPYVA